MNKLSLILAMSLVSGGTYAQGTGGGVTESTDPAKAAAVEQHAQDLQARQSKEATAQPATTHTENHKAKGKTSETHKSSDHKSSHKSSTHKSSTHKSSTHKPATEPKT